MPRLPKNNSVYFNVGVLIAIILVGFALYFVPLQSPSFNYDDQISIVHNAAIRKIDLPRIFNAFNTRFLPGLSFALNYKFCALHPFGYRLTNLLIHCLNAFLVYLLVQATLYLCAERKLFFFSRLEWPAFFAALLFLCHPIQTDPVNFITQRFVLMGAMFYLASLYSYVKSRLPQDNVNDTFLIQRIYYICALITAIAAMFCKEFVVTLPFMLALYEFYFLNPERSRRVNETIGKRCGRLIPFFVIILIVPILLLRTPPQVTGVANIADSNFIQEGGLLRAGDHIDITRARGAIGRKPYFWTELHVLCTYVRLLFVPVNQNFDYDYPISYHVDKKTALCGLFLLCLLALAAATYKSYRLVSFGILWFFIALSVESSFIPIGDVIVEYRLYLASAGFVILVMSLVYSIPAQRKSINMIALAILIGFSILTYQRNKVWRDDFSLWNDTVGKSPHKARPYAGLGFAYDSRGDLTRALSNYNKAIEIEPDYAEVYSNRGGIYGDQGKFSQAIADCTRAIALDPYFADAYNNRGSAYYLQGNLPYAIADYTKAVEINPDDSDAYNKRGSAWYKQGDLPRAIADYTRAIAVNPDNSNAYYNRAIAYSDEGNLPGVISDYTRVLAINPDDTQAMTWRAYAYYYVKEYDKAWGDVRKLEALGRRVIPKFINLLKRAAPQKKLQ